MKLVALALALLAATAAGQTGPNGYAVDCGYDRSGSTLSNGQLFNSITTCLGNCAEANLPNRDSNITSNPVTLVYSAQGEPDGTQTRFVADELKIVVDESLKYYGKGSQPELAFGECAPTATTAAVYKASSAIPTDCKRTWTLTLDWDELYSAYKQVGGTQTNCKALDESSVEVAGVTYTQFTISIAIVNYEAYILSRPSGPIYLERSIRHAITMKLRFARTASISTTISAFSELAPLAAITQQQAVTVDDTFDGKATATLQLYTSIQDPFVIDDVRIENGDSAAPDVARVSGDLANEVSASSPVVNVVPVQACSGSACTEYSLGTPYRPINGLGDVARANVQSGSTCDDSDDNGNCFQYWQFKLRIGSPVSGTLCNFNGKYRVKYTIRCNQNVAESTEDEDNECPINIDTSLSGGDRRILKDQSFLLDVTSSNHCPSIVATISLESKLYTHPAPAEEMGAIVVDEANGGELDVSIANGGGGKYPRPRSGANRGYILGQAYNPESNLFSRPDTFDDTANTKDDFLQGQIVIGVARTVVGEATVTKADFLELSITHPTSPTNSDPDTNAIIVNGALEDAFKHGAGSHKALKFLKVADTTLVRKGFTNGGHISTPYFAFVVDTEALQIGGDQNAQVTIEGTIRVTYQSAAASLGAELQSVDVGRMALSNLRSANSNNVRASINVGGSGSSAGSGAAASEATVLGLSANVAAGAALAAGLVVGVLVGVLAMTLLSRPAAPKRSESQVQLTGTAV